MKPQPATLNSWQNIYDEAKIRVNRSGFSADFLVEKLNLWNNLLNLSTVLRLGLMQVKPEKARLQD